MRLCCLRLLRFAIVIQSSLIQNAAGLAGSTKSVGADGLDTHTSLYSSIADAAWRYSRVHPAIHVQQLHSSTTYKMSQRMTNHRDASGLSPRVQSSSLYMGFQACKQS